MIVRPIAGFTNRHALRLALVLCLAASAAGCATKSFQEPSGFDIDTLRERTESVVGENVLVFATIPTHEEIKAIFGIDLWSKKVQPVWLEVDNQSDRTIHFMRTGLDPEYFSPREVAFAFSDGLSDDDRKRLVRHLEKLNLPDIIDPRSTASGFVLTNQVREVKFASVDLLSEGWTSHMQLVVPITEPTLRTGKFASLHTMISTMKTRDVEKESELRALLESLPCCTTNQDGIQGEPLNVVLIGNTKTAGSALLRRDFRYAPLRPMFAFGRPHDIAVRKSARWNAAQPHELRVWLTDIRFQGKLVWVGQISMPLGGRFAGAADEDAPQVIDPDVDAARYDLVQDAMFSQMVADVGFVHGAGAVSSAIPRTTPGGSTYHTDGLRAVLIFDSNPVSLTEIEFLGWGVLTEHHRP